MAPETHRTLDHQYFVRAPASEVFRAFSDPRWLTRWLCDRAEMKLEKGGAYLLGWNDGPTHTGTIVELVVGERIALAWTWPGVDLQHTVFSLSVAATAGGSLVRIAHSGFPRTEEWTELYGGAEWGWTYFAMNLKSVLESGRDLRSPLDG